MSKRIKNTAYIIYSVTSFYVLLDMALFRARALITVLNRMYIQICFSC